MDIWSILLGVGLLLSVGVNLTLLLWWLYTGRKMDLHKEGAALQHYTVHLDGQKYFAQIDETEIRRLVQQKLAAATAKAATRYEQSLDKAVPRLVQDIEQMNSRNLRKEFEKHQVNFQALNDEALQSQARLQHEIQERRQKLIAAVDKKVIQEYEARLAQLDQRLGEIVTSYIVESLAQPADLGAQLPGIIAELERHKEQIKQDVLS